MTPWPGNPIGSMDVDNYEGGTESSITLTATTAQQIVQDVEIDFGIDVAYHDHPYFDNGRGYFSARLDKLTTNGWVQEDVQSLTLGNDNDDGDWYDTLTVSVTMTDTIEQYRIVLHCETQDTSFGTSEDFTGYFQAVQGQSFMGTFALDFVPVSIVYCPPGQDMTASLTQSESYGTRFTIGESSGMQSQTGVQFKVDVLGLFGEGVGFSQSQSTTNTATSGIQVSHFRSTVVTADNQKAIGRAYWGPLGDLFVILVNPTFEASRRADGTILYALSGIEQVLAIPAWKLLRPDGDPIASAVPADVRRQLLGLDPFIRNLDLFFPDSGADIGLAANPFADPSANNRAELIGRWWLDTGAELNYALGETHQLFSGDATQVSYSSTVSINANVGADFDGITAGLQLSSSDTTTVGFQTSQETDASYSKSASCFLIHNQNERDLDGIEIYYDKVFSTFMFRRVAARRRPVGPCIGGIRGAIYDIRGLPLRKLGLELVHPDGEVHETITTANGEYGFSNLCPGTYRLRAGDKESRVVVGKKASVFAPVRHDVRNVRRVLDLSSAPVWEVSEALGVSSDVVRRIGANLTKLRDVRGLAKLAGVDDAQAKEWAQHNVLNWPKPRRSTTRSPGASQSGGRKPPATSRRRRR
jgi:hypothetical protein